MFIASFYCYLKHDSKKDFVIDFDNLWKWLGFTRKDNAKTCLEKHFLKEIDYKVEKTFPAQLEKFQEIGIKIEKTFPERKPFLIFLTKKLIYITIFSS